MSVVRRQGSSDEIEKLGTKPRKSRRVRAFAGAGGSAVIRTRAGLADLVATTRSRNGSSRVAAMNSPDRQAIDGTTAVRSPTPVLTMAKPVGCRAFIGLVGVFSSSSDRPCLVSRAMFRCARADRSAIALESLITTHMKRMPARKSAQCAAPLESCGSRCGTPFTEN